MIAQPEGLISVLLDKSAREDERHDAAMDLSLYPSDKVIEALYRIVVDTSEEDIILDSCGESLATIWISRNQIDKEKISELSKTSFLAAKQVIQGRKPEWLIYFDQ